MVSSGGFSSEHICKPRQRWSLSPVSFNSSLFGHKVPSEDVILRDVKE